MPSFKDMKSLRHMPRQMAFVFAVFSVSTFAYGFDNVVYSTIQAMDGEYQTRHALVDARVAALTMS